MGDPVSPPAASAGTTETRVCDPRVNDTNLPGLSRPRRFVNSPLRCPPRRSGSRPQSPPAPAPPAWVSPARPGRCRHRKKAAGRPRRHGHILFLRTLQANCPGGAGQFCFRGKCAPSESWGSFSLGRGHRGSSAAQAQEANSSSSKPAARAQTQDCSAPRRASGMPRPQSLRQVSLPGRA